jgi:hypothetical protein
MSGAGKGNDPQLTERQKKWFESVRESFVRDTGKTLDEWVAIARTCPETKPRARVQWLKDNHGLGVNRAATVLGEAFPSTMGWDQPDELRAALWTDKASEVILKAIEAVTAKLEGTVSGQRKAFTAFSRKVQYAAARPVKGGHAMLGLAVEEAAGSEPRGNESWSERCKVKLLLKSPAEVDDRVAALLKRAWERS